MIRDPGPIYVTGFGTTSRNLPIDQSEEKGSSSEAGFLSKRLNNHPFQRFLLYNGLAIAGMAVAGAVVRQGGVKLAARWGVQEAGRVAAGLETGWRTELVHSARKIQKMFDDWQGIDRYLPDLLGNEGRVSLQRGNLDEADIFNFASNIDGPPTRRLNFHYNRAVPQGGRYGPQFPGDERWRDVFQQALIRQARRMPYELPAIYATQRFALDPLFGYQGDQNQRPKFYNPIDVLGDFAQQSLKNTAMLLTPLDVVPSVGGETWRRMMASTKYMGSDPAMLAKRSRAIMLSQQLELLGQDASNLLYGGVNAASRATGAFGAAIGESVKAQRGKVQYLHDIRKTSSRTGAPPKYITPELADVKIGPVGGLGTFVRTFKGTWDSWDPTKSRPAHATSDIELVAESIVAQAPSGRGAFTRGLFYRNRMEAARRALGFEEQQAQKSVLEQRIHDEWDSAYRNQILPWLRNERLRSLPIPAEGLQRVDEAGMRSLHRQMAKLSGYDARWADNAPISEVRNRLTSIGHNINDLGQVRAFLESKKALQPLWGSGGYNALGLKPLSISRANELDYFKGISNDTRPILNRLIQDLRPGDIRAAGGSVMEKSIGQLAVGKGIYETRGGKVVDFSPIWGSLRRAADLFEQEFKIPLLQFNPLSLLRWRQYSELRHNAMIQTITGPEAAPFIRGRLEPHVTPGGRQIFSEKLDQQDSLLFLKDSRTRGRLLRMGGRDEGGLYTTHFQRIPGVFRSMPADIHLGLALGNDGLAREKPATGWRKVFSVNEDQPQSIFRFFGRWRQRAFRGSFDDIGRPTDIDNPRAYASAILSGRVHGFTDAQRIKAMQRMLADFNRRPLPVPVLRELREALSDPSMLDPNSQGYKFLRNIFGGANFDDLRTAGEFKDAARQVIGKRPAMMHSDPTIQGTLKALQEPVHRILREIDESGAEALRAPTDRTLGRLGIHRRYDVLRDLLYKELISREAVLSGSPPEQTIASLMSIGESLYGAGKISGRQLSEFRGAVLGMHLNIASAQRVASSSRGVLSEIRLEQQLANAPTGSPLRQMLESYANFDDRVGVGRDIGSRLLRMGHRFTSTADYQRPGEELNLITGREKGDKLAGNLRNVQNTFVPTFGTRLAQNPVGALKSVFGINTWSSPDDWSGSSVPVSLMFQRLNRYFSTFGMGLRETDFKGPLDMYARGMVGQRVLPIVAGGATILAADSTVGGYLNPRDDQGKRVYSPYFLGHAATSVANTQAALAGLTPGGMSYSEKKEQLFYGEVPIRRGRWWPLGNTPWKGDRIQYFRPSWYRRFRGGEQYTGQMWDTPLEKLMYGYDFSPLRPLDPYRFERKHYYDRPYPVTGEYFTGPWGPVTGALNATIGQVMKPRLRMHKGAVEAALGNYQATGYYAAEAPGVKANDPRVLMRTAQRQSVMSPQPMREVLGYTGMAASGGAGSTGLAVISGSGGQGFGGTRASLRRADGDEGGLPVLAGTGYGSEGGGGYGQLAATGRQSRGSSIARNALFGLNEVYADASQRPSIGRRQAYGAPILVSPSGLRERPIARAEPVLQSGFKYQSSMLGYQLQELAGIYGFGFGSMREAMGLGSQDISIRKPVLMSSARATGAERAFWDLNLGGMGDAPTPFGGEYSNLEISEIVRRFVPHRRRDENEVNPIPNRMGVEHPWLPGADYFNNFKTGDPYTLIPNGEIRLPGAAYERYNRLHSDSTGRYGLVDKLNILGDVAPWSNQYKALEKAVQLVNLRPDEKQMVEHIKDQVRQKKKTTDFSPYEYAHQDFQTTEAKILGFVPGSGDKFYTDKFPRPIRLSGVRGSRMGKGVPLQNYMSQYVNVGDTVDVTFDANKGPLWGPTGSIDAYVSSRGVSLNQKMLESGLAKKASTYTPLDRSQQENPTKQMLGRVREVLGHRNTLFNNKFMPERTAVEDWERRNVYGATFPQWQHPIRDFLKPMVYKAANRDVVSATVGLAVMGAMFGRNAGGRQVGGLIGAMVGLSTSLFTNARSYESGDRFIPKARKEEMALEEYVDILKYVKFNRLYSQARIAAIMREGVDPETLMGRPPEGSRRFEAVGPMTQQAIQYKKEISRTMYGADPFGDLMDQYQAIPKRKRKHFLEFLKAPISDRARILSTAPRLERRIYEARWGMKVEKRPDLAEYFQDRELPGPEWEGWRPDVDLETVKLKMANHMGLDASQMGYYPQQVKEANLLNPSYPDFNQETRKRDVEQNLRNLMYTGGMAGNVRAIPTPFPGVRVEFNAQV